MEFGSDGGYEIHPLFFKQNSPKAIRQFIESGGKVIVIPYVMSFVFFTSRQLSDPHFVAPGKKITGKLFLYFLLTLFVGIWSPQGFFWSLVAFATQFGGGQDVTQYYFEATQSEEERLRKLNPRG